MHVSMIHGQKTVARDNVPQSAERAPDDFDTARGMVFGIVIGAAIWGLFVGLLVVV